jgi:CheY-like chemotaxis protein
MSSKPVILHVEDDPNDVLLVGLAFRKSDIGAIMQVVNDGEQAVQYLAGQGAYSNRQTFPLPTIVLLDLKLPRRSGLEVLSWVRGQDDLRRLPIIMLTSSNQQGDITKAYDLGINSFLVKPSALEELTDMVRKICGYWLELNVRPPIDGEEM